MSDVAPPGVPLPQFTVKDDVAVTLADLMSIQADLGHVAAACRWLHEKLTSQGVV